MAERLTPGAADWVEFAAHHIARYLFAADYGRDGDVLDAGTGCGYGTRLLRAGGARSVVGVDIDDNTLAQAQQAYGGEAISFVKDDCETLSRVQGPFQLITNFENIEHLAHPERFLAAAGRLLAADGVLITSTPDRAMSPPYVNGRPVNPYHVQEWYRDEFGALLSQYFADVDLRSQVESSALASRIAAVESLRDALVFTRPAATLLWRKTRRDSSRQRRWKLLSGLAAPTIADYPILPLATAPIFGREAFHVALCRGPKTT